ncbi:hypothetical protein OSTOST_17362 [Ostertagia ostertagi]
MNTEKIDKHTAIKGYYFDASYNEALKAVRQELKDDAVRSRPQKEGLVGFIAGEGALALEKDGQRGEVVIKVATTFDRVLDILEDWSAFRAWVVMWPIDSKMDEVRLKRLLKMVKAQVNSGGKIVSVWPPVNEKNMAMWLQIQELWSALDSTLMRINDDNQIFVTSSSKVIEGKLYIEAVQREETNLEAISRAAVELAIRGAHKLSRAGNELANLKGKAKVH